MLTELACGEGQCGLHHALKKTRTKRVNMNKEELVKRKQARKNAIDFLKKFKVNAKPLCLLETLRFKLCSFFALEEADIGWDEEDKGEAEDLIKLYLEMLDKEKADWTEFLKKLAQ